MNKTAKSFSFSAKHQDKVKILSTPANRNLRRRKRRIRLVKALANKI